MPCASWPSSGDLSRFSHPRQLMGYLGLIPSEDSSGERRRQGAITKAGNSSARRALVEAAWAYQHAPAVSPMIARRQTDLPKAAIDIAWKAQLRLCARFRRLAGTRAEPQQDRRGDRARARRLRVGHRAAGQAAAESTAELETATHDKEISHRHSHTQLDRRGGALAVGESSAALLDRTAATPQSLERGSSVTNNSLAANQRPHISLIDRRHR